MASNRPTPIPVLTPTEIPRVQADILTCFRCELSVRCSKPVPGHYPPSLTPQSFIVLGEAPERIEDQVGQPFVGPAGLKLRAVLRTSHLDPDSAIYINTVSCWPRAGELRTKKVNQVPFPVKACRVHLRSQLGAALGLMKGFGIPNLLCCGGTALNALLPNTTLKRASGQVIRAHGMDIWPVYHPSYILQNKELFRGWEQDIANFARGVRFSRWPEARCVYCGEPAMEGEHWCYKVRCTEKAMADQEFKMPKLQINQVTLFD